MPAYRARTPSGSSVARRWRAARRSTRTPAPWPSSATWRAASATVRLTNVRRASAVPSDPVRMKDAAFLVVDAECVELLEQARPPLFAARIAIVVELVVPYGEIVGEIAHDATAVHTERRGDLQRQCDDPLREPARLE